MRTPHIGAIDRFFVSTEWELRFPNCGLHSHSALCLYHAPLLLHTNTNFRAKRRFHF